jgi:uncharacterized protein YkvS
MKDIIVMIFILPFLLFFPIQSIVDDINRAKKEQFDSIVYNATQKARFEGCFKSDNINELKSGILKAFNDIEEGDIIMDLTTTPKYRADMFDERETINYRIAVPIKRIFAMASFFGIDGENNKYWYGKEGYVLSEVLVE